MKPTKAERAGQVLLALTKSLCYLLLFLGMQVLVALPLPIAAGLLDSMGQHGSALELLRIASDTLMLQSALSGVLTLLVVIIFYRVRRKRLHEALWLRPVPAPTLLTGASLAPALYFVVTLALASLPEAWLESYGEAASGLDSGSVMGFIAVALVAPVVEEFIFRGLMMTRLSQAMPGWLAVLLSAAIFGVCHGHPVWFGYAFVLGAFFGMLDLRTGSICPSILGHIAFNLIGQIFSLVPESENDTEMFIAMGVLLLAAIILLILNRPAILDVFRPARASAQEFPPQDPHDGPDSDPRQS